jgi:hypothetical protein
MRFSSPGQGEGGEGNADKEEDPHRDLPDARLTAETRTKAHHTDLSQYGWETY